MLSDSASDALAAFQPAPIKTSTDKDVPVFPRVPTSLLLAALLIFQSVVPCCAISMLLAGGRTEVLATKAAHACSCCPHPQSQQEPVTPDNGHSPDGKCPYCGGLLFHSGLDDATLLPEVQLVFASFEDATKLENGQVPVFPQMLQQQVLGQPFLNTGMRLLI